MESTTAMQAMPVIVPGQLIRDAINRNPPLVNPVSITSDGGTEIIIILQIILNGVEAQHHIAHDSFLIRNHDRDNTPSIISDTDFHAILVFQDKQIRLYSVNLRTEV